MLKQWVEMVLLATFLVAAPFQLLYGQHRFYWANTAGGQDNDEGRALALDQSGNIYLTGNMGWKGGSIGNYPIEWGDYLVKYDNNGNILWAQNIDTGEDPQFSKTFDVCTDPTGNIYVAGTVNEKAYFGNDSIVSYGKKDMMIVKYGPSGNFLWARHAGGAEGGSSTQNGEARSIQWHGGNLYVYGKVDDSAMVFGSGSITDTLHKQILFVAKYGDDGSYKWSRGEVGCVPSRTGFSSNYGCRALDIDDNGGLYITGWFSGYVYIDTTELVSPGGGRAPFVIKYDASGQVLWAKQMPDTLPYWKGYSLKTFPGGGCVITGSVYANDWDFFMARYSANGKLLWDNRLGGPKYDEVMDITVDNHGNSFITGWTDGEGRGSDNTKLLVAAYDSSGNELWTFKTGPDGETPRAIAGSGIVTDGNDLYLTGEFRDKVEFPPHVITSREGPSDFFIAKMTRFGETGVGELVSFEGEGPQVYPNPAVDYVNVRFPDGGKHNLQLLSPDGKVVMSGQVIGRSGQLDVSGVIPGLYYLQVRDADKVSTKRIIKY